MEQNKKIKVSKNGPYLVSGNIPLSKELIIPDKDGPPIEWKKEETYKTLENYALCRCGNSKNKIFCDGSHVRTGFDGTETADKKTFDEKAKTIEGPGLILKDATEFCASARFCDRCTGTWELTRNSNNPESKKLAIIQACNCPSGRLVACSKDGKTIEPAFEKSISITEDASLKVSGPIWVKGKIEIESGDGSKYETRNRVTLCRCGQSKNKPFCDGSHVEVRFNDGDKNIN